MTSIKKPFLKSPAMRLKSIESVNEDGRETCVDNNGKQTYITFNPDGAVTTNHLNFADIVQY